MKQETNDLFGFNDYIYFLKEKLDKTRESQVVGIHGDYGAGKTTSMILLINTYGGEKAFNILLFSAWRNYYDKPETVWKAFLYELAGKIREIFSDKTLIDKIEQQKLTDAMKQLKLDGSENDWLTNILSFDLCRAIEKNNTVSKTDFERIVQYVDFSAKEIQVNLYQDLEHQFDSLVSTESEANKDPKAAIKTLAKGAAESLISLFGIPNLGTSDEGSEGGEGNKKDSGEDVKGLEKVLNLLKKEEQTITLSRIDSLEVIQRKFNILLEFYNLFFNKPLIIIIDDMDRIDPIKSVDLLEILRIFFELNENIHFVVAIDLRVVKKGIERKFNQLKKDDELTRIEMEEYLEKIITLPFDLPAIPYSELWQIQGVNKLAENELKSINSRYFKKDIPQPKITQFTSQYDEGNISVIHDLFNVLEVEYSKEDGALFTTIQTGLQANPRKIKRFLNVFEVYLKTLLYRKYRSLSQETKKSVIDALEAIVDLRNKATEPGNGIKIAKNLNTIKNLLGFDSFGLLAKLLIIKLEWEGIYREFTKNKFYLYELEKKDFNELTKTINTNGDYYKIRYLFGLLQTGGKFSGDNSLGVLDTMRNIYLAYYLIPQDLVLDEKILKNENTIHTYQQDIQRGINESNLDAISICVDLLFLNPEEGIDAIDSIIETLETQIKTPETQANQTTSN